MAEEQRTIPFYRLSGTHREIGRQFGEACVDLIRRHRDLAMARLGTTRGITPEQALASAMHYRAYVEAYAPFLDEEVQGVAEGARIPLAEAYLLQLRAELAAPVTAAPAPLPAMA